jgi:inorganic phosphate transporter, PiT family
VIYFISRRHKITHANVTDSHEVLVLAAATPTTYADDPRLDTPKPKKAKRPKAKSAA